MSWQPQGRWDVWEAWEFRFPLELGGLGAHEEHLGCTCALYMKSDGQARVRSQPGGEALACLGGRGCT